MKNLLVITDVIPETSDDMYKEAWDNVEYFQLPDTSHYPTEEAIERLVAPLTEKIGDFYERCDLEKAEGYVTIRTYFASIGPF